ncbi:MAG: class I SAM-dependent methyltransferase [Gemmataceae bacterium]|nr:class I SAM-dependent methyltransferase [Gemmata sp.]MDW8196099.1 class I SAM-dependent methyltransferase [Gemmataceae bacterium]
MPRLTEIAHSAVRAVLTNGEVAIDATAGNGWDTQFLLECVGRQGHVFAFDIQPQALAATAARIGDVPNVTLLARNHAELRNAIPTKYHGRIGAVMFNLGYWPGSDHAITTTPPSTLAAITAAWELLRDGGILTILAYTGHPGGAEEAAAVEQQLRRLGNNVAMEAIEGQASTKSAPRLWIVRKCPLSATEEQSGTLNYGA